MRQVIFLSFYCKVYKKNPVARIYIGDIFIDEIEIPYFSNSSFDKENFYEWDTKSKFLTKITTKNDGQKIHFGLIKNEVPQLKIDNTWKINNLEPNFEKSINPSYHSFSDICGINEKIYYPKIFIYYVENKLLEKFKGKITIEIKNNDSNYTNGFVTKQTFVGVHGFYVIPEMIVKNPIVLSQHFLDRYSRKSTSENLTKLKRYYILRESWPHNLSSFFYIKNKFEKIYSLCGDVTIKIELFKKFNIWWGKKIEKIGFIKFNYFFVKYFIVYMLNKCANEDKRNTN